MTATFPSWMPRPKVGPVSHSVTDTRQGRGSEFGPPRYRRTTQAFTTQVALGYTLTDAQKFALQRFFDETLDGGTLPFVMPNSLVDGFSVESEDFQELTEDDGTVWLWDAQSLCMWGDSPPTFSWLGGGWNNAKFTVVYLP